jgi:protein translocase SecG subunit
MPPTIKTIFIFIQIALSLILIILIFLQPNQDGESRSNILSSSPTPKRGWERFIFQLTVFIFILFLLSSIIQTTL